MQSNSWNALKLLRFVKHGSNVWTRLASEHGRWKGLTSQREDVGLGWFAVLESVVVPLPQLGGLAVAPGFPSEDVLLSAHQCAYGLSLGEVFQRIPVTGHVVSLGGGPSVCLVDCLCYPGGEGALITANGKAVGILVSPLFVEEVPATLSIAVTLVSLQQIVLGTQSAAPTPAVHRGADGVGKSIVHVTSTTTGVWGSGIIVGHGRVLTAAHVVRGSTGVVCNGIECVPEFMDAPSLDVASLRSTDRELCAIAAPPICKRAPVVGAPTLLISFGCQDLMGSPCVTRGVLLRIFPWMLISSNAAFSGSSGGALFLDSEPPELLGLIVSTPASGKMRIPGLSLSIPISLLTPLIEAPELNDQLLCSLRMRHPESDALWSLALRPREPPGGLQFQALQDFLKSKL